MSDSTGRLCVRMPGPGRLALQEHVWRVLAGHLGVQLEVVRPAGQTGVYEATLVSGGSRRLRIGHQPERFSVHHLKVHTVRHGDRGFLLPAGEDEPGLTERGQEVELRADVILGLLSLLNLWEEHEIPYRDRFGLVEGQRSPRQAAGLLSEPLMEHVAAWLAAVLEMPRPDPPAWGLAVSCDVDVLDDDHMPAVLDFLASHGVRQPTFMICAASADERTIRDPRYDLASRETRRRLEPLRRADVEIGLHGSYLAHDRPEMLSAQRRRLEDWCGRAVAGHRAHFFRFAWPRSWAWQRRSGLAYDASLGYPDVPGLRCGAASPWPFLDPEDPEAEFMIVPTAVLDQHFFWPAAWEPPAFEVCVARLLDRMRTLGGFLTLDWHTYTLGGGYPEWWDRLAYILQAARREGAQLAGIAAMLARRPAACGAASPVLGEG